MQLALSSLDRRLGLSWERAGLAKARNTPVCVVRLDRLEFTATGIAKKQILDIPGFRSGNNHFVRRKGPENFLPYRRVANFESDTSIRKMDVLYEPTAPWIAPFKVTLISHDKTGLQPGDALSILELLPGAKVIRIEVAFDFGRLTSILPVNRRDFDRAFSAWLKDRTPQNEAALRVEQRKNEIIHLLDSAVIALVLVAIGSGIYVVIRFARHKLKPSGLDLN
jgi:hypothetical protein